MNKFDHFWNVLKNGILVKFKHRPHFDAKKLIPKWYCPVEPTSSSAEPIITWIGQATFLLQVDGINILTDPIFFNTSPLYKRLIPPGIAIDKLPKIHVVAISHNHIDHMDKKSLLAIKRHNPLILAPFGDGMWFWRRGFKNILESKWGSRHMISGQSNQHIKFTYLPASHWSGRYVLDFNRSACGSWMIEHDSHNIYFAGDSSYDSHFKEIAKDFKSIHTALLPVGPVEPRDLVDHAHLDGKQAIQAFIDLNAKQLIPMHWGTFQFGAEDFEMPIELLKTVWGKFKEKLAEKKLLVLKFGERRAL